MAALGKRKLILLCLLLMACDRDRQEAPAVEPADTVVAAPVMEPLSDNEALDVLMALSTVAAGAAGTAPELVATPELRRYLNVVRADHQALAAELRIIADSLDLTPEAHATADRIRTIATPVDVPAEGEADATVMEQQITLQRLFLEALDSAVLRGPRNELLLQYATAMRPTVSAHLQRAEQLERLLRDRARAARAAAAETGGAAQPDTLPNQGVTR